MFFWAIFDQSASTWIFFANTYMDCTLFGTPTPPDSIQAFNPLFIVAAGAGQRGPVQGVPGEGDDEDRPRVPADRREHGHHEPRRLPGRAAQKADKLTFPGGRTRPATRRAAKLSDVKAGERRPSATCGSTATDWAYNADKKKLEFANGIVTLAGGRVLKVSGGHYGERHRGPPT